MSEFRLGEHVFVTTPGRDALAALRKAYLTRASAFCAAARAEFDSLPTPAAAFGRQPMVLDRAFDQTVAAAAEDIAEDRIYHVDAAALRHALEARAKLLREAYDRIRDQYRAITEGAQEREALRAAEAGSGSSVIGGGFGVEGAAKGVAIATAANVAIGAVHGAANAVAKAAANAGDQQKREQLYSAPETQTTLMTLLHGVILEGHIVVAEIVNHERAEPTFDVISMEARRRALALTANVEAGRVPGSDIALVLMEALQLDPFREKPWCLWLDHLGDPDGGLVRAAEALGVAAVPAHKSDLLERKRAALAWSTPEECQSSGAILHEVAQRLGLPFDEERRQIEGRAKALDCERRTFMGSVYGTTEEAKAARVAAENLARRTVDGVAYKSRLEAEAARAAKVDEAARTFRKFVYPTLRAARLARDQYYRSTSLSIWAAIIFFPLPIAMFTLKHGFRTWQRVIALSWMALVGAFFVYVCSQTRELSGPIAVTVLGLLVAGAALGLVKVEVWVRKRLSTLLARRQVGQAEDASAPKGTAAPQAQA